MPRLLLILLILFYACNNEVQKDTSLSFTTMGYNEPGLFVFRVKLSDSHNKIVQIDTLGLFCSEFWFPRNAGQRICQWQLMTIDTNQKYTIARDQDHSTYEGVETCDSELFMHPARDIYRVLQFCPYPYFKNAVMGSTWNWSFDIGANWAIKDIYPITSVENFQINYTLRDTVSMQTKFGELYCHNITAVSRSKFGVSTASYFLNNAYGMVRSAIKTIDSRTFEFELIAKTPGIEGLQCNKYFLWDYNRWGQKQNDSFQSLLLNRK